MYGTTEGVGTYARRWIDSATGDFTSVTEPTQEQVTQWLTQCSGLLDAQLSELGFTVPVVEPNSLVLLDMFACELVAARVENVHGAERATSGDESKITFTTQWLKEITEFVKGSAEAFVNYGVPRRDDNKHSYYGMFVSSV